MAHTGIRFPDSLLTPSKRKLAVEQPGITADSTVPLSFRKMRSRQEFCRGKLLGIRTSASRVLGIRVPARRIDTVSLEVTECR